MFGFIIIWILAQFRHNAEAGDSNSCAISHVFIEYFFWLPKCEVLFCYISLFYFVSNKNICINIWRFKERTTELYFEIIKYETRIIA